MFVRRLILALFLLTFLVNAVTSQAAPLDNLKIVATNALFNNKTIGSFAYDAAQNAIYISTFNAGSPAIVKVTGFDTGSPVSELMVTESEMQLFYRSGDPNLSVSNTSISGFLLNPKPIVQGGSLPDLPAYSFALITDLGTTRGAGTSTPVNPALTKRIYSYNLGQGNAPGGAFTSLMTLEQYNIAGGLATSNTSSNIGRQFAWSSNGQSIYFLDSGSNALGGIWKAGALGTNPTRLYGDTTLNTVEPAVLSSPQGDRIVFEGSTASGNAGGISMLVDNGSPTLTPTTLVPAAVLQDFFELTGSTMPNIRGFASDANNNLYFYTTQSAPERRGIYMYDAQGRLSKVIERAERIEVTGNAAPGANSFRIQPRTFDYNFGTAENPNLQPLTQLFYAEPSPVQAVGLATVFKPGDFNRDNILSALDINLLKSENVVTTRGVAMTTVAGFTPSDYKFDMNGNAVTDWKDIKIMQSFFDFGNGDVDLNGVVDFADFQILQNNFNGTSKTWFAGDLDGNDIVNFADFQILQNSFGYQSSVLTGFTLTAFNQAEWDSFVAAVPEPSTYAAIGGIALAGLAIGRRRTQNTTTSPSVAA